MGDFNVLGAIIKVALTFGLLFLTLKLVARVNGRGLRVRTSAGAPRPVELVGRTSLGRSASVALVRMGERCFALGVTEQKVNVLSEVEIDLTPPPPPAGTQGPVVRPSWRELVESLRERTVRR